MKKFFKKKVFIIAEAGVNHNGCIDTAKKMIDLAAEAGADAIKFQTFRADNLLTPMAPKADYQKRMTNPDETQYLMIKKLELSFEMHQVLSQYCLKNEILFISSPFDKDSVELLNNLAIPLFKIPSGEITNLPFLRQIGKIGKPVILSTGMATLNEIRDATAILAKNGLSYKKIALLHCTTDYPADFEEVNLKAMNTISKAFPDIYIGYSDHTPGIEVSIAAVGMGAKIIEKHFTLNKQMKGPDHKASLEPHELKTMINAIRNIEKAIGNGIKKPGNKEKKNISIVRKSIVAATTIQKGDFFCETNITAKRPGTGISPMLWDSIVGQQAKKEFQKDEPITL